MKQIESKIDIIINNFAKLKELSPTIYDASQCMIEALKNGNKILFCGNGGSAADCQHLASELVGKYKINRKGYNAIALTTDTSILTAISNDYGYETVFSRQVESIGKLGDVLIALSTSGNSKNVINAIKVAKNIGIKTISMTGENNNELSQLVDISINVPSNITNNIQEMHIAIGHLLCESVENKIK